MDSTDRKDSVLCKVPDQDKTELRELLEEFRDKQAKLECANIELKNELNSKSKNYRAALEQMNRKMSIVSRESQSHEKQFQLNLLGKENKELICQLQDSDNLQQTEQLKEELELTRGKLETTEARNLVVEKIASAFSNLSKELRDHFTSGSADSSEVLERFSRENIELRMKNETLCNAMVELLQTKIKCDEQATTIKALEKEKEALSEEITEKEVQLKASLKRENQLRKRVKRKKVQQFGINISANRANNNREKFVFSRSQEDDDFCPNCGRRGHKAIQCKIACQKCLHVHSHLIRECRYRPADNKRKRREGRNL